MMRQEEFALLSNMNASLNCHEPREGGLARRRNRVQKQKKIEGGQGPLWLKKEWVKGRRMKGEGDDGSDCRSRRIRSGEGIMRTMPLCLPAVVVVTQGFIPAAKQSPSIGQHRSQCNCPLSSITYTNHPKATHTY